MSIRTIGIDSSKPIEIFADEKNNYAQPYSWSSDGKYILAVLCNSDNTHSHEIILISLIDHSVKNLKKLERGYYPAVSLSPDGKYVSYSFTPDLNSPKTDIYLLNVVDGTENVLINHPETDFNPLWMPDSINIIFFSDREREV